MCGATVLKPHFHASIESSTGHSILLLRPESEIRRDGGLVLIRRAVQTRSPLKQRKMGLEGSSTPDTVRRKFKIHEPESRATPAAPYRAADVIKPDTINTQNGRNHFFPKS